MRSVERVSVLLSYADTYLHPSAGRSVCAHVYRLRIERTVESMLAIHYIWRPTSSVYGFLDHCIPRVTALLRDLHDPDLGEQPTELLQLVHNIMAIQDQKRQQRIIELYRTPPPVIYGLEELIAALMGDDSECMSNPIEQVSRHSIVILRYR